MGTRTTKEVTTVEDSLEEVFGVEPGTTIKEIVKVESDPVVKPNDYDEKDNEIDEQFQTVYEMAIEAYEYQMDQADSTDVDPKYVARMHEVASTFLTTALAAAKEKANLKQNKDKTKVATAKAATATQQNLIVSHSDLMSMLFKEDPETGEVTDILDGDFEQLEDNS